MNRVTIINLAGSAWHVEDDGVALLQRWLDDARGRLASDPDRDELIADFERAIADRFADLAPGDRDVITVDQARTVTEALGTVEPAPSDDDEPEQLQDAPTEPIAPSTEPAGWREKRLYRLTGKDEEQVSGVCAGLAAYFNVDVTVVRVIFVLLALITSGVWIVVYIAMAIIVPEAKTSEDRAAARGYGESAQELVRRAREQASPALTTLGSKLAVVGRFIAIGMRVVLLIAILILLVGWAATTIWLVADPDIVLAAFDPGTSTWLAALWLSCIAWLPIGTLLLIERAFAAATRPPRRHSKQVSLALVAIWIVSFVTAIGGMIAIPANNSQDISEISRVGHVETRMFHQDVCVELRPTWTETLPEDRCAGSSADVIISDFDARDDYDDEYDRDYRDDRD